MSLGEENPLNNTKQSALKYTSNTNGQASKKKKCMLQLSFAIVWKYHNTLNLYQSPFFSKKYYCFTYVSTWSLLAAVMGVIRLGWEQDRFSTAVNAQSMNLTIILKN